MTDLQPLLPRKIPPMTAIGDAPVMPDLSSMSGMSSPMPILPPIVAPNVIGNPRMVANSTDPLVNRMSGDTADLYDRTQRSQLSGLNKPTTTLGKIGHVAANIGNVLGDIFAPSTMALIPGTGLNNQVMENKDRADIGAVSDLQTAEAARKQQAAQTAYTAARPEIETAKLQSKMDLQRVRSDQLAAKAGQKPVEDADGNVSYVDDPESAAFQSRKIHDDVMTAQQQLAQANESVKEASLDPNSPAYKMALDKAATAKTNAAAAVERAQAYYGRYLQSAYNTGLKGDTLPGSPQIENATGGVTTVGTGNAAQAAKSQTNAAMFNDVHGALDNLEAKATALVNSGGRLNSPGVVYAMQHSSGTPSQIIQSLDKANLSPEEREYVMSNLAAHENVQALRKSAGGLATDQSVEKLDALLPTGSTPDLAYLKNQTNQIRQTAERLGKGVTTAQGGLGVRGQKANNGSSQTVRTYNPATGRIE
jgi:hypothetical protein